MTDSVLVERIGGAVCLLTINRPDQRNAVNADVARRLGEELAAADADPEVRAVVVTGAGERAFCAGADLGALSRGEPVIPPEHRDWGFAGITQQEVAIPTIAAVNGVAMGGGLEIVLACDVAVASTNATFALPEVRVGQLATAGGLFRLVGQLPPKVAAEMLLTGDAINAEAALRWGLVSHVVDRDEVVDTAVAIATRIAANAPLSVEASRRVLREVASGRISDDDGGWQATKVAKTALRGTHDAVEGARAFAEKRPPTWLGR